MKDRVIGREKEWQRLEEFMQAHSAQLIEVCGRLRVGKTFLIEEFFNRKFAFRLTGVHGRSMKVQLGNFIAEYNRRTGEQKAAPKNWQQAFELLRGYLSEAAPDERKVVFIDEMPWLDTMRSGFAGAFEWFWNDWGAAQDGPVFVACGSAALWMISHFDANRGGLFSRQTCRLYLEPFTLSETGKFLKHRNISWSRCSIAEAYMIMGGIPFYLNLLNGSMSLSQNIDNIFFRKNGELHDEFSRLYQTLFSNSDAYIRVAETLSEKTGGMTRQELQEKSGIGAGGDLSEIIRNLVTSGFVRVSAFYKKKKKDALYQLSDYYTAFYFRYIKDHYGRDEHFWSNAIDSPARRSWAGLAFGQLCKDHIRQIRQKLGISGVLTEEYVWYTKGDEELGTKGAQIDLVLERRDMVINLCEMKYSINVYAIDRDYDAVLRNKIDSFRRETGTRSSLQLTMITTYGLTKGKYSNLIQNQVTLDDLFAG